MASEIFQEVYPFTTESINGYFNKIDFNDKSVLTVGSSSDQAFNAILLGAKNITVYDINKNTSFFGKLKRQIIIENEDPEKMYQEIISSTKYPYSRDIFDYNSLTKMNNYMTTKSAYLKLRELLIENNAKINYIIGNILDIATLKDNKYDIIILSNVLQYIDKFISKEDNPYDSLNKLFLSLKSHLNDDGLIQLLYYYGLSSINYDYSSHYYSTSSIPRCVEAFDTDSIYLDEFSSCYNSKKKDAVLVYKKR